MKNGCEHIQQKLPEMVGGELEAAELSALREHLDGCADCRRLAEALEGQREAFEAAPDPQLTKDILRETSGAPCEHCQDQLVAHADGETAAADSELIQLHLDHCPACGPLAEVLAWMPTVLEDLRELELDEDFVHEVMAATVGDEEEHAPGLLDRLKERWQGALRRPLFPLEAAYVAAVVMLLLFGTSYSPFKDVPPRALALLRATTDSTTVFSGTNPLGDRVQMGKEIKDEVVTEASSRLTRARVAIFTDLSERGEGAWGGMESLGQSMGELGKALAGEEDHHAATALNAMGESFKEIWNGLRKVGSEETDADAALDVPGNEENQNPESRGP